MRRLNRRWKVIVFVVVAVCGLIVFGIYRFITKPFRLLAQEVAAIRQNGEPVEWKEVLPTSVPDADNAAPIYQKAFALLYEGTEQEKEDLSDFIRPNPQRSQPVDREVVRRLVKRNQAALALVRQAVRKPVCQFPVDWDPLDPKFPHYAKLRHCVRLMAAEALLKKQAGKPEEAIADLRPALQMAKQMETEHPQLLIPLLVRCALYAIAWGTLQKVLEDAEVSPQTYRALLQDLEGHTIKPYVTQTFIGERCFAKFMFDAIRSGAVSVQDLSDYADSPSGTLRRRKGFANPLVNWVVAWDEAFYLKMKRQTIQLLKQPGYPVQAVEQVDRQIENAPRAYMLTRLLAPVHAASLRKAAGAQARLDLLRLALALRLYRHEHGNYPAALKDLQPAYLRAIPPDPFTNQPFVYRREGKGFLLYSFGENRLDDGGTVDPKRVDKGDIVWRSAR